MAILHDLIVQILKKAISIHRQYIRFETNQYWFKLMFTVITPCFWTLKNKYFGKKYGVSENKGCPKSWGNYCTSYFVTFYFLSPAYEIGRGILKWRCPSVRPSVRPSVLPSVRPSFRPSPAFSQ